MESLVIRLGSQLGDPVHWLVWSGQEQEIIASGMLDDATQLSTLAQRAGNRPITALVPGCDFYLKWVTLPAKASRKAISAIPYMLEEELSTDINEQFFALGQRQGQLQAVAVVSKQKMFDWLQAINQAGLFCDKLIPDVLALPHTPDTWSMLTLGDQVIVRQDQWQGLQGDISWVLPAVEHFAKQQTTPLQITNFSEVGLTNLANVNAQSQPLEMPMQVLATGALNTTFNLLQGDYKPKKQNKQNWHQWRLAAALAAIAFIASLVDKSIELNRLNTEKEQIRVQIQGEYQRAFPGSPMARLVRKQMEKRIAQLESGGGSTSMLMVLSQLSDAFESSKVKPQSLRFDSARAELRMQAVASNFEALEQFKRLAKDKGFEVEQGAINNKDNQVIGALSIRS